MLRPKKKPRHRVINLCHLYGSRTYVGHARRFAHVIDARCSTHGMAPLFHRCLQQLRRCRTALPVCAVIYFLQGKKKKNKMDRVLPEAAHAPINAAIDFVYSYGPAAEKTVVLGKSVDMCVMNQMNLRWSVAECEE